MPAAIKPLIAVDIDDVLSDNVHRMVAYSNERWGAELTIDDYDEHWGNMWRTELEETKRRATEYHSSGIISQYGADASAIPVLRDLSRRYRLAVVTSRRSDIREVTLEWLQRHYGDIFEDVHFAGMWDNHTDDSHKMTKAETLTSVGAAYLIDDQLKHCLGAAEHGIPALLFGTYAWNRTEDVLPPSVSRVHDWSEVWNFFHDKAHR